MKRFLNVSLSVTILGIFTFWPAGNAHAKAKRKSIASTWQERGSLALDSAGHPHIAYQSADHHVFHTWSDDGKKWQTEQVDFASDAGWGNAIAVDALGRVHLSYHAERMNPYRQVLVYAVRTGGVWAFTEVDDGGWSTSLVVDGDQHPHILYNDGTALKMAHYDGATWEIVPTGLSANWFHATSLALDATEHAHITYMVNTGFGTQAYYATDAGGDWEATPLGTNSTTAAVVLTAAGLPIVAVGADEQVHLFRSDGAVWSDEIIYDVPDLTDHPERVALALNAADNPVVLISTYVSAGAGGVEVLVVAAFDGEEWRGTIVGSKNNGFDIAVTVGADGRVHGTYRTGGTSRVKLYYLSVTMPDVGGEWGNLTANAGQVTGVLTVANHGTDKSKSVPVVLYLSDDAVLDPGDVMVPATFKASGLKPGTSKPVTVNFQNAGAVSGKYLIAVIDPAKQLDDLNRLDNTAVALFP